MRFWFLSALMTFLFISFFTAEANIAEKEAFEFVDTVQSIFQSRYAPYEWKKATYQWDLEKEIERVKQRMRAETHLTVRSFHRILKDFFHSLKDYHVKVRFYSTESASLPFQVKGIDGRYFVSYVDIEKLSQDTLPIKVGDELISFDGRNPGDLIQELLPEATPCATAETDQSLAESSLTSRHGERGMAVPKGAVLVKFVSAKSGKPYAYQLMWEYKPEMVFDQVSPSTSAGSSTLLTITVTSL